MRKYLIIYLPFLLFLGVHNLLAQGVAVNQFNINQDGSGVKLEWEMQDMNGISEFRIYRKMDTQMDFGYLATIPTNGSTTYSYIDHDAFRTTSTAIITYQLRVVKNGTIYTFDRTFTHSTTAIRQTWGSIKSMFR